MCSFHQLSVPVMVCSGTNNKELQKFYKYEKSDWHVNCTNDDPLQQRTINQHTACSKFISSLFICNGLHIKSSLIATLSVKHHSKFIAQ